MKLQHSMLTWLVSLGGPKGEGHPKTHNKLKDQNGDKQ
jgi:hypothetical protein